MGRDLLLLCRSLEKGTLAGEDQNDLGEFQEKPHTSRLDPAGDGAGEGTDHSFLGEVEAADGLKCHAHDAESMAGPQSSELVPEWPAHHSIPCPRAQMCRWARGFSTQAHPPKHPKSLPDQRHMKRNPWGQGQPGTLVSGCLATPFL